MRTAEPSLASRRVETETGGDSLKPSKHITCLLRIIGGAAFLGAGATAAHLTGIWPEKALYLAALAAVCAITTGTVEIVRAVAGRSSETRRMVALQRLARRAESSNERLSMAAILSLTPGTLPRECKETAEIIRVVLGVSDKIGTPDRHENHDSSFSP